MKIVLQIFLLVTGTLLAADSTTLLEDFSTGNKEFAAAVYKELIKSKDGNIMVCPLSAEIVLALVHAGAGGGTAKQLSNGLRLPDNTEQIQQIFHELNPLLMGNKAYTLTSANKIYVKDGYVIQEQFNNTAVGVFNAEITNIDFENVTAAANEINKWVSNQTHDKITNIVSKDDLRCDIRAVLVNAMYFNGNWSKPFNVNATLKRPFYLNRENQTQIDMMEQTGHFKFLEDFDLSAQFLEMSYEGDDFTMTIALPFDLDGLNNLETRIVEAFGKTFPEGTRKVHIMMPKFKFETHIEFTEILQAMGITDIFTQHSDLRNILEHESLKVNEVVQKTYIEVEEKGTTAAAVTRMGLTTFGRSSVRNFIANHPFMFWIKIKDVIVFNGRYSLPTEEQFL